MSEVKSTATDVLKKEAVARRVEVIVPNDEVETREAPRDEPQESKTIGVVGGVGPYAGLDLVKKLLDMTDARCDQDHLPILVFSTPHRINDRTDFLMGRSTENPGDSISEIIERLHQAGAEIIGLPCNTAHAPPIYNTILKRLPCGVTLVHLIDAVATHIASSYSNLHIVGVLSTTGTRESGVYPSAMARYGFTTIQVSDEAQAEFIDPAIYHPEYGIKVTSNPVSQRARAGVLAGIDQLINRGAQVIVLGCTELSLAVPESHIRNIPVVDCTTVLAHALIVAAAPTRLAVPRR